jgi:uncharacterized protein
MNLSDNSKQYIVQTLLPYTPEVIGIFGSYARNQQKKGSDLDILIRLKGRISLLKLVMLEQQLSETLGMPVDLVTEQGIRNQRLLDYINKDLIIIYSA